MASLAPRPTGTHRRSGQLDHLIGIRKDVPPRLRSVLFVLSFVLPLLTWSVISYVPFVWHPFVKVENPGSVSYFEPGMLVECEVFADENRTARAEGRDRKSTRLNSR